MVTKMKKKCVGKYTSVNKKGQIMGIGETFKIVLIITALVVGMGLLATQKEKIASVTDYFMAILAQLGFVHLSDNDAIALASMQATACAVDVVAKYSSSSFPTDGTDIFAGIDSCEANLFDDTALMDSITVPKENSAPVVSSGGGGTAGSGSGTGGADKKDDMSGFETPSDDPKTIDTSKPIMTVSRGNVFTCNSIEYTVTISNIISDTSPGKVDFTVVSDAPKTDTVTITKGTGYWSVGDIRIRLNSLSSTSSVSGKLKCNGYAVDYSGTTGTFGFANRWAG